MAIKIINHIHFNYELIGQAGEYPPIVFIAGYACDINFWRPVAESFQDKTQVLIFDNQGIGNTVDNGEILTVESMALNINKLIESLGLQKPFVLMGFALGGIIAQKIAADFPDRIKKLVLLNSVCQFSDKAKGICERLSLLRKENKFDDYAELIYEKAFGIEYKNNCTKESFIPDFISSVTAVQTAENQQRQVQALVQANASNLIKKISAPTLVLGSDEDFFASVDEAKSLASKFSAHNPNVKLSFINNSGHAVIAEQLDELISQIERFILADSKY